MRQRRIKNLEEKIALCGAYLIEEPEKNKGRWHEIFGNHNPIYLEIGCGKGKFIAEQAASHPERNYIAVEGQSSVVVRALEKAQENELINLRIFIGFVNDLADYFEQEELSGIFLNFSDPWPKARHEKRRLTYRERLNNYASAIKEEGYIEFKTDNDGLFQFTLGEIQPAGLEVEEITRDLHGSSLPAKNITTEYEEKFKSTGKNINYVKMKKTAGRG